MFVAKRTFSFVAVELWLLGCRAWFVGIFQHRNSQIIKPFLLTAKNVLSRLTFEQIRLRSFISTETPENEHRNCMRVCPISSVRLSLATQTACLLASKALAHGHDHQRCSDGAFYKLEIYQNVHESVARILWHTSPSIPTRSLLKCLQFGRFLRAADILKCSERRIYTDKPITRTEQRPGERRVSTVEGESRASGTYDTNKYVSMMFQFQL